MGESACAAISREGNLEVLRWVREQDPPLNVADTCGIAAKGGRLEVLQWMRERDDSRT